MWIGRRGGRSNTTDQASLSCWHILERNRPRLTELREAFEDKGLLLCDTGSWAKPSDCFLGLSSRPGVKRHILPLNPAWKANDAERAEVMQFFQHTLRIANTYSRAQVLEHIGRMRQSTGPGTYSVVMMDLYKRVSESVKLLSADDARQLKYASLVSSRATY